MGELLLPAWPKEEDYPYNVLGDGEFDHDLAAAYAARLRVAVEALQEIAKGFWVDASGAVHMLNEDGKLHHALDCVAIIGELPCS